VILPIYFSQKQLVVKSRGVVHPAWEKLAVRRQRVQEESKRVRIDAQVRKCIGRHRRTPIAGYQRVRKIKKTSKQRNGQVNRQRVEKKRK